MSERLIPWGECVLLSRRNARRYCGGLGDDRFDREVVPHVPARILGGERFYVRAHLDKWAGVDMSRPASYVSAKTLMDGYDDALSKNNRRA